MSETGRSREKPFQLHRDRRGVLERVARAVAEEPDALVLRVPQQADRLDERRIEDYRLTALAPDQGRISKGGTA
jgi:hypothetical protein